MEKEEKLSATELVNSMVDLTLTRHCKTQEEEFLKELGFENSNEEETVRNCTYSLLNAITKEILMFNDKLSLIDATLKLIFEEKGE